MPPVVAGLAAIIAETVEQIKNIEWTDLACLSLGESGLDIWEGKVYLSFRF